MGITHARGAAFARGLKKTAVLLLACFAGAASAENSVRLPEKYIAYGGYYMKPGSRPIDYAIGFDVSYGQHFGGPWWLEGDLFTNVQETGRADKPDDYQSGGGFDVLHTFGYEGDGHFFALGGAGASINSATGATGSSYFVEGGAGYRGRVWQEWGLRPRVELKYVYDTIGTGTGDWLLAFKMEIPPKRQIVVEKIVEKEKIVEVPVEVEKIVEKNNVCVVPPTPQCGPVVPADVPDADHDGIPDSLDHCPGTLAGAKVDGEGCVKEEQKISLPNIEFESGKTVLAPGGKQKLESVVTFLQNQAEVKVDVFGHTDSQGKDELNQKLSEGRARSVMQYLVSRGIAAERLSSKGFGETQPIASNETAQGRAQNRRVELLLRTK